MRLRAWQLWVLWPLLVACGESGEAVGGGADAAASGQAAASASSAPGAPTGRVGALRRAELTRQPAAVGEADLADRRVEVRRAAARALARIRGDVVRSRLLRLLSDEDAQVVAWAAYGLGQSCHRDRDVLVQALAAAAMSQAVRDSKAPSSALLMVVPAITRAIGRCATGRAEQVLASWVREHGAAFAPAIEALGDVASRNQKLREETVVTLLDAAAGSAAKLPVAEALYPLGRLEHLPPSVLGRTLEVAKVRLAAKDPARWVAVRALGRCDDAAVPLLENVASDADAFVPLERVEATRQLARFGGRGQRALQRLLPTLLPDTSAVAATSLVGPAFAVALTALRGLTVVGRARPALRKLAGLTAPPHAPPAIIRRISLLRCSAAGLLVERDYLKPLLRECDLAVSKDARGTEPLPSLVGARAVVAAIGVDGVKIRGKRLQAWRAYVQGGPLAAREAAIAVLGEHDEIADGPAVLGKALRAKQPGLVAAAAAVIAEHPRRAFQRAHDKPKRTKAKGRTPAPVVPEPALVEALLAALDGSGPVADIEARAQLISAVAALRLDAAKPVLAKLCRAAAVVIRNRATKALVHLAGKASAVECGTPPPLSLPVELDHLVTGKVRVLLDTEAGQLSLDLNAALAPVAVTRVVDLVKKGAYTGMVVHRVVPGFVSQFGSPTADGYGGAAGLPPLACETSPVSFGPLAVGVALAGRDTGSSQLFVTHAAAPHLDGDYAYLGQASGGWDALVEGDVIKRASLAE